MLGERAGKRLDRGQQALLQPDEDQPGLHGALRAAPGGTGEQGVAVGRQQTGKDQFGAVGGELVDHHWRHDALGERLAEVPQVGLEAAHHDGFEVARPDLHPAGEPLRVEHFEQGRERVGVAVVRRGGEEKAVLEAGRQGAHRLGKLAVHGVAGAVGGRGVVGFVEDQQRAGAEFAEQVAQPGHVGLVGQQAVGDDESRAHLPRIGSEPALAAKVGEVVPVDDRERQPEFGLQLVLPLPHHAGRGRHDDEVDPPAQQQFAQDKARFDRFAQPDIIGDQQIDPGKPQRLAQREKLVGIQANARAERRLEQVPVCRGRGIPLDGAQVGREDLRVLGGALQQAGPVVLAEPLGIQFRTPDDFGHFSLGVVVDTGQGEGVQAVPEVGNVLHQPPPVANLDEITELRMHAQRLPAAVIDNAR